MRSAHAGLALLRLEHLISVAVVSGDKQRIAILVGSFLHAGQTCVNGLHRGNDSAQNAGMADHVAVRIVAAQELVLMRGHGLDQKIGDLHGLHRGRLLKRDDIGRNLGIVLKALINLAGAVAVPEVGDVAVFLRLRHSILMHACLAQNLGQRVADDGRLNQIVHRDLEVAVIFQHTCELHASIVTAVKLVKVLAVKGEGNFLRTVAAEVEEDDAVAVFNLCNGLAVMRNDERQQILIDHAGILGAVGFNGLTRGGELTALSLHMRAPALFDHRPVGLVAIHGNDHAAAAGGDLVFMLRVVQFRQNGLQLINIVQRTCRGDIAAVEQDVAVDLFESHLTRLFQHRNQVRDIGMDVAVGQQADEVQRFAVLQAVIRQVDPRLGLVQGAGFNGLLYKLCALRIDLAAAESVVADLGVAHIVVRGQADGGAVCFEPRHGAGRHQVVERRGVGLLDRVAGAAVAASNTVHNDKYDRFFHWYSLLSRIFSNFTIFYYNFPRLTT